MDNAGFVSGFQPLGDLKRNLQCLVRRQNPSLQTLGQGLALGQLHDEIALALVLLETVESRDVLMAERGKKLCLSLETGNPVRILSHRLEKHLDRHLPIKLGVPRPIHLSHAPCAEGTKDLVTSKTVTG